jgi:sec-independent protein translocase protein TatB
MFDIGFSEMEVCAIVALVVIGPERLPRVARTLGVLFGRLQRYVAQVKSDINREMELAELGKVKSEFENAARSFQAEVQSHANEAEREMRDLQSSVDQGIEEAANAANVPAQAPAAEPAAPSPQLELDIADSVETTAPEPQPAITPPKQATG